MPWHQRQQFDVLSLSEIATLDRFVLETACRGQVQPVYLGDHTALCRILGRYKFYVDTRDQGFGSNMLLDGFWEMWVTRVIAQRVKAGMIAIDIGANYGYYSLLLADLVGPEGRVIAVEPNPHVVPKLRSSLALNGFQARSRIVEAVAAASSDGFALLRASLLEPKNAAVVPTDENSDPGSVQISRVPRWSPTQVLEEFGRIDFLKIDAEGSEEDIIDGLMDVLRNHRPDIVLEFNALRYGDAARFLRDLVASYPSLQTISYAGEIVPVGVEEVLTTNVGEDWLLYLTKT